MVIRCAVRPVRPFIVVWPDLYMWAWLANDRSTHVMTAPDGHVAINLIYTSWLPSHISIVGNRNSRLLSNRCVVVVLVTWCLCVFLHDSWLMWPAWLMWLPFCWCTKNLLLGGPRLWVLGVGRWLEAVAFRSEAPFIFIIFAYNGTGRRRHEQI